MGVMGGNRGNFPHKKYPPKRCKIRGYFYPALLFYSYIVLPSLHLRLHRFTPHYPLPYSCIVSPPLPPLTLASFYPPLPPPHYCIVLPPNTPNTPPPPPPHYPPLLHRFTRHNPPLPPNSCIVLPPITPLHLLSKRVLLDFWVFR